MRKINNPQGAYTESLIEGIGELAATLTQSLSVTDERGSTTPCLNLEYY